jgi:type II secretory pathway component PulM
MKAEQIAERACTCHPDDAPTPCAHKYALSACLRTSYEALQVENERLKTDAADWAKADADDEILITSLQSQLSEREGEVERDNRDIEKQNAEIRALKARLNTAETEVARVKKVLHECETEAGITALQLDRRANTAEAALKNATELLPYLVAFTGDLGLAGLDHITREIAAQEGRRLIATLNQPGAE